MVNVNSKARCCAVAMMLVSLLSLQGGLHDVFSKMHDRGTRSVAWCGDHQAVLELLGTLAQVPGILTADSENAWAIKASAVLSMVAIDAKIIKELFKDQQGCLAKQCVYNVPKTLAYALASLYDYVRLTSPHKEVKSGSAEAKNLRSFKISQFFHLGVEMLFRIFAYMDSCKAATPGHQPLAGYLSEAADWVELWRLLSRFNVLSDQDASFDARLEKAKQQVADMLNSFSSDISVRNQAKGL